MAEDDGIVLPESLVAELIEKVGGIAKSIDETFSKLVDEREDLRKKMLDDHLIHDRVVDASVVSDLVGICVDGAQAVQVDRATSYGISCVARVGPDQSYSSYHSNMFILPHLVNIEGLAGGFMMMQEMMMAVEAAKAYPNDVVFIDGGKVTFIIKINQFYTAFFEENKMKHLDIWRKPNNVSEAANILRAFEARDWFKEFFCIPNIVGLVKLVTTDEFIERYLPAFSGRFDDKVLAALVLEPGERTRGVAMRNPEADRKLQRQRQSDPTAQADHSLAPYHMGKAYPHHAAFEANGKLLTHPTSAYRLSHSYFNAPANSAIYKVEFSESLDDDRLAKVFEWLADQSCAADMLEPYTMYVADRFVKEAVCISREAISEITRTQMGSDWAFSFTGPNRTS